MDSTLSVCRCGAVVLVELVLPEPPPLVLVVDPLEPPPVVLDDGGLKVVVGPLAVVPVDPPPVLVDVVDDTGCACWMNGSLLLKVERAAFSPVLVGPARVVRVATDVGTPPAGSVVVVAFPEPLPKHPAPNSPQARTSSTPAAQ